MKCDTCTHKEVCKHTGDYTKASDSLELQDIFSIDCNKYKAAEVLKPVEYPNYMPNISPCTPITPLYKPITITC